jgi:hypothetical protein
VFTADPAGRRGGHLPAFVLHRTGKRWILNADRSFKSHILLFRAPAVVVVMVGIVLAVGFLPYICEFFLGRVKKNLRSLAIHIF